MKEIYEEINEAFIFIIALAVFVFFSFFMVSRRIAQMQDQIDQIKGHAPQVSSEVRR